MRSKVELFEAIRRDHRREGLSIRALSDKYEVHRRTVRQALESAVPPERKVPVRVGAEARSGEGVDRRDAASRTSTRRASSATPPGGSWPGWSTSTGWAS